jgi:hypothetical protein
VCLDSGNFRKVVHSAEFHKLHTMVYDLELSRRLNSMTSSRAISRFRCLCVSYDPTGHLSCFFCCLYSEMLNSLFYPADKFLCMGSDFGCLGDV